MDKAAKKRLDAKKRLLFESRGDARSPEERAMLDALQQKLEDDALREDEFYFLDGEYVAARRPRTTSGMKMRSYDGHVRSVKAVALVHCDSQQSGEQSKEQEDLSFVFSFGLDRIGIWDFKTTKQIASLDVSNHDARFIRGAAAALGGASVSKESDTTPIRIIHFAYATHSTPILHTFDPTSKAISAFSNQHDQNSRSTRSSESHRKSMGYFCAAHQQQITSMAFSHNARVLATCSWDSACMLWRVLEEKEAATPSSPTAAAFVLRLVLVQILPVHELGASFACFTLDDQQLITTGECTVKLWDIAEETSATPDQNLQDEEQQRENWGQFEKARVDWEAAIPFAFSVEKRMDLLAFDEALTELVPNHEWQNRSRDCGRVLRLLSPEHQSPAQGGSQEAESRKSIASDGALPEGPTSVATPPTHDPVNDLQPLTQVLPDPSSSNQEGHGDVDHLITEPEEDVKADASSNHEDDTMTTTPEILSNILSLEDAGYLEKYYRDLVTFDFEQLLNPTLPLRMANTCEYEGSSPASSIESDKENQSENEVRATSESKTPPTTLQELIWNPLQPNANGKLLKTFSEYNSQGILSAHTSTITCCAVSKELGIVVTVALDKMLKFWPLESGQVLETVREAHSSQITCCTLTTEKTLQNPDGVLAATGGKDNLVKVWRRNTNNNIGTPVQCQTECIYSFSGHYDALTSCVFDATGVFLITTGDDTNVITWRVVPSSPDQPKALRLVSVDKFAITVSWDEPLANGSPLLHYVIRTTQVSSLVVGGYDLLSVPDVHVPAKYTSKVIENLQPGIQYTLQIAAVNAIGSSLFSDLTPPIETLAFVPSRVENPLQYSDRQATRLRLSWKQPSPNGALIQSFTIRCLPENSVVVPVLELSIPIAELEAMASLTSGSANGEANTKKNMTTTAAKQRSSAASKKLATVSNSSSSSVSATVAPPPADVFYSYVVEGLWAGEIYQFVAAAENRCGLGAFSHVSDYVEMDPTAPDPPSQPQILNVQKRQVDIVWEKPKCNGSEILQHTLEWIQEDRVGQDLGLADEADGTRDPEPVLARNSVVLLTRSISSTNYTLQGLDPDKPLRVWLSASNLIDNKLCTSAVSPASDIAVALCDVPDKPARPELVQPSAHTLVLAFTPPKCNGLEIQSYDAMMYFEEVQFGITNRQVFREFKLQAQDCQVQQMGSNGLCMSTFTVQKLRGKACYSVKLCAINALGASLMSECSALVSTKPPTVPARMLEPPVILDIEPTRASISWGTPEHDGGAPLVAFHLQYSSQPTSSTVENDDENGYKALFDQEVTIFQGQELLATFMKPKTTYRFRVASSNAVGKAPFSKKSVAVHTPSLVEFTISRYFADRPEVEHVKARFIQKRYRAWKLAVVRRKSDLKALRIALCDWHIL